MKIEWESLPIYTLSPCGPTKKFFHMKKKKKKIKSGERYLCIPVDFHQLSIYADHYVRQLYSQLNEDS